MANDLENVTILDVGQEQLAVNQIGIDLVQAAHCPVDPVVEVAVVRRRASGLLETEVCTVRRDSLAKMAEHLTIRSNFESAQENAMLHFEDEHND